MPLVKLILWFHQPQYHIAPDFGKFLKFNSLFFDWESQCTPFIVLILFFLHAWVGGVFFGMTPSELMSFSSFWRGFSTFSCLFPKPKIKGRPETTLQPQNFVIFLGLTLQSQNQLNSIFWNRAPYRNGASYSADIIPTHPHKYVDYTYQSRSRKVYKYVDYRYQSTCNCDEVGKKSVFR